MTEMNASRQPASPEHQLGSTAGTTLPERDRWHRENQANSLRGRAMRSLHQQDSAENVAAFSLITLFLIKTQAGTLTVMEILRKFPELQEPPQPILHSWGPNLILLVTSYFTFLFPLLQEKPWRKENLMALWLSPVSPPVRGVLVMRNSTKSDGLVEESSHFQLPLR